MAEEAEAEDRDLAELQAAQELQDLADLVVHQEVQELQDLVRLDLRVHRGLLVLAGTVLFGKELGM